MTIEGSVSHGSASSGLDPECLFFLLKHQIILRHLLVLRRFKCRLRNTIHKISSNHRKSLFLDLFVRYRQHLFLSRDNKVRVMITPNDFCELCVPSWLRKTLSINISSEFIDAHCLHFRYLREEGRIGEQSIPFGFLSSVK